MGTDASPSPQMEAAMLQQVVPRQENIHQSRTNALQNVESTITELGGIFTHLATMVAQQGELAIRYIAHIQSEDFPLANVMLLYSDPDFLDMKRSGLMTTWMSR